MSGALAAVGTIVAGALAPPATGEVRTAFGEDPAGDATPASLDIFHMRFDYDPAGKFDADVAFRDAPLSAPPPPSPYLTIVVGTGRIGLGCGEPSMTQKIYLHQNSGFLSPGGRLVYPSAGRDSNSITTTVDVPQLIADQPYSCVTVSASFDGESAPRDVLDAPLVLPGAPAPAPAPAPPVQDTGGATQTTSAAAGMRIRAQALRVRRGRVAWLRVRVTNDGAATATGLRLRLGGARGIRVVPRSRTVAVPALAAGQSRTVSLGVRALPRARRVTRPALTLTGAHGVRAATRATITVLAHPRE